MDQNLRNKLRNVVTQCRRLLEDAVAQALQGQFGIYATGKKNEVQVDDAARMGHLAAEDRQYREQILVHLDHIQAGGFKPQEKPTKPALDQLVREVAFTHLNRLCAYKMMECRGLIREAVSRGLKSQGFLFYLAEHDADEKLHNAGHQDVAYRHFLNWLGGTLSEEIGVLFSPHDSATRLWVAQRVLDDVLALLNSEELKDIWTEDEAIGWVYQYFTPKELRDQARKESAAPRNSYELAFRNQFFTPRYVVEFLTDNTLGRIWYEMRKGDTALKDRCRYLVCRPSEMFLAAGETAPADKQENNGDLSQEELLKQPVYISHRAKKDPRDIKALDPACGSGHFLLYCFDLLLVIYEEAYSDPDLGPALKKDYPTLEALRRAVPGLILSRNLHGIDIDLRATQIAALALWLRAQRSYQDLGIKNDRPKITRSNIVCAEPMPGEKDLLDGFLKTLQEDRLEVLIRRVMQVPAEKRIRATAAMADRLCELVRLVWEKMQLAGEAGSLLKIEEELQEAIREGQVEFEEKNPLFRVTEYSLTEQPSEHYYRFVPGDVEGERVSFWDMAERLVLAALQDYAAYAANGNPLQRQLFVEDAVRGFAFVDLCRKRFDVALMNPPFGSEVPSTRDYLAETFPQSKHDLSAITIERTLGLLAHRGRLGAITTRTILFVQTYAAWRQAIFDRYRFSVVADLGYGVLDAMVETAIYAIENDRGRSGHRAHFFSVLTTSEKETQLQSAVTDHKDNVRSQDSFSHVPGKPLAYWVPEPLLNYFRDYKSFLKSGGSIRVGVQTGDDFRFYRLAWEVSPELTNARAPELDPDFKHHYWLPAAKGGEYSPWWDDIHLVTLWHNNGQDIKHHPSARPQNVDAFFKPGLTYPYRTTSGFAARCLPRGASFSVGGWGVFPRAGFTLEDALAIYNSRFARYFMEVLLGQGDSSVAGSAARNHVAEAVGGIPWSPKTLPKDARNQVQEMTVLWRTLVADETCIAFSQPVVKPEYIGSFAECLLSAWKRRCAVFERVADLSYRLDQQIMNAFSISGENLLAIAEEEGNHPGEYQAKRIDRAALLAAFCQDIGTLIEAVQSSVGSKRFVVKKSYFVDRHVDLLCHLFSVPPSVVLDAIVSIEANAVPFRREAAEEWVSYAVGSALGRWDVRVAMGNSEPPELGDPFDPLPVCSPGTLIDTAGLPAKKSPPDYPLRVEWEGIIVDDPDHSDDIVCRVREVLELIWKDRADSIEKEACDILGVKELRDYFRKPTSGGFWDDHVKRYSKSRRKAPIYWLLQSSKKNYALWLYYHRLDKDILFKALENYVRPKVRLEDDKLKSFRTQRAGATGKDAKQLDKQIEKQEAFVSELRDFEEKLKRAADLHLDPDLNDGVVLNIAPLWELVPWKEAKAYWQELLAGEYEWSTIGKHLRERKLVK